MQKSYDSCLRIVFVTIDLFAKFEIKMALKEKWRKEKMAEENDLFCMLMQKTCVRCLRNSFCDISSVL